MKWRRRTDDARRTKGDPPATYAQLLAEIRENQAAIAKVTEMATSLRSQADALIAENARLRHDMKALRERLPSLTATDPDPTRGYIAAWETRYAETGQVPAENDPWKDEQR